MTKPAFKEILKVYLDYCISCLNIFLITIFITVVLFAKDYKYIITTHNHSFWYYVLVFLNVAYIGAVVYSFINLIIFPLLIAKRKLTEEKDRDC